MNLDILKKFEGKSFEDAAKLIDQAKGEYFLNTFKERAPTAFKPFISEKGQYKYKGAHGGRGSGKSHFFAEMLVIRAAKGKGLRAVCLREVQKSLKQSVKRLLEDKIEALGLGHLFEVQEAEIKCPGGGIIIFQGLQNHTADSIKSLEGFDIAWVEEAQSLSQKSLSLLRPTMRADNCEIWFTWNPDKPSDPVDSFLRPTEVDLPPRSIVLQVNWQDNPFFPSSLVEEKDYDFRRDKDRYLHVWEGQYARRSESRVFHNWQVEEYETPADARLLFGADWGFSQDPTTLIRGFIGRMIKDEETGLCQAIPDPKGRHLFLDYEAVAYKLAIDKTPKFFEEKVPDCKNWPIRADSARPETIEHCQKNGFPRMVRSTKGPNSVKDGVEFIKSFDVVIHTRCKVTEQEFLNYSFKVDDKTDEILPELNDKDNHIIDPVRYMLELIRKAARQAGLVASQGPKSLDNHPNPIKSPPKTLKTPITFFVGGSLD